LIKGNPDGVTLGWVCATSEIETKKGGTCYETDIAHISEGVGARCLPIAFAGGI